MKKTEYRRAVTDLCRRAADELAALNQEAEDLLNEGEMLYRGHVLRFQSDSPLTGKTNATLI